MAFKPGKCQLCEGTLPSSDGVHSESQYRAKLKFWKIGKHATANVWVFIDGRLKKRTQAGKKTDVLLYGELQPPPKVAKEIARNVTVLDSLQDLSDVPTPDGVSIQTPSPFSPIDSGTVGIPQTGSISYSEFVGLMTPWIGTNAAPYV